jgi:uncharacterized membrane protein YsdA (DUF1294 family)
MPSPVLYGVLAMNALTFAAFGLDKWRARRARRRISEARLLVLTWATGLFGGWMAMAVFRHKTRKSGFRVKMALVTLLNLLWPALYLSTGS